MGFKDTIGPTGFTMILLISTRIFTIINQRFAVTLATGMYFLHKNHS